MTRILSAIVLFLTLTGAGGAWAQQSYWIQIEAKPTLTEAQEAARQYDAALANVAGFRLSDSGWYAIAIGPFDEKSATDELVNMRLNGTIPSDAFLTDTAGFSMQFWPIGGNAQTASDDSATQAPAATDETAAEDEAPAVAEPEPAPEPEPEIMLPDETRKEALQSERALDSDQRKALQVALQWEGFYKSLIDGDFGPGTRGAMADWQEAEGYDPTGVLTSRQRAMLMKRYNDMLASLGLGQITDQAAGIEITIPTAMVSFSHNQAPFAYYEGDKGVRVILISQRGDKATLYGLYDILQTLSVVPVDGERSRGDSSFRIHGENAEIITDIYATLIDGAVKGYMLIWPRGEKVTDPETGAMSFELDKRRSMVIDAMQSSFASTGDVAMPDNAGLDQATQSIDLISGLEIRRAEKARSGFYVSAGGAVLTTTEAVAQCGRITLDENYTATVAATDDDLGLALLMPTETLAPIGYARFLDSDPRLQSDLSVSGYSFGGRLSSPTLTFGTLADIKGLAGETTLDRLDIKAQDGDTGGPVLDASGSVAGMLLATPEGDRLLPANVGFAAKSTALSTFLTANEIEPEVSMDAAPLSPYALSKQASDMTVLVSCWK
ncbi:MAG: serine protease [Maritimibacter sp.]